MCKSYLKKEKKENHVHEPSKISFMGKSRIIVTIYNLRDDKGCRTRKKRYTFSTNSNPLLFFFFYLLHLSIPLSFSLTWTTKEKKTKKGENLLPRGTKNQAPSSLLLNKNANLSFILFSFLVFRLGRMVANPIVSLLSPCKMVQKQGSKNYFPSPLSP